MNCLAFQAVSIGLGSAVRQLRHGGDMTIWGFVLETTFIVRNCQWADRCRQGCKEFSLSSSRSSKESGVMNQFIHNQSIVATLMQKDRNSVLPTFC